MLPAPQVAALWLMLHYHDYLDDWYIEEAEDERRYGKRDICLERARRSKGDSFPRMRRLLLKLSADTAPLLDTDSYFSDVFIALMEIADGTAISGQKAVRQETSPLLEARELLQDPSGADGD
jgi:hypothetical protein